MKLIDDWATQIRKAWSIRLAGIAGLIGAYFVAYPGELERLTSMLPEQYREPFALVAGFVIFSTAAGARLAKQGSGE
jgi:hypothetical protein